MHNNSVVWRWSVVLKKKVNIYDICQRTDNLLCLTAHSLICMKSMVTQTNDRRANKPVVLVAKVDHVGYCPLRQS